MNIQEYIESGELELYAAGGLTEAQRLEVEQYAQKYPEVNQALQEACLAMESYALMHAFAPRPEMEEKITREIFGSSSASTYNNFTAETTPLASDVSAGAPVIPMSLPDASSKASWYRVMGIAASILLILSVAGNLYLYNHLKETEQQLSFTRESSLKYAVEVNQWEQRAVQAENQLGAIRNPLVQVVRLKGVGKTPEALATVYWNQQTKEVLFDAKTLPAAPAGKQYQLWSLQNGQPQDAGVSTQPDKLNKMKEVEQAQAFAVTLEPEGGSASPTLEAMVVMGTI